MDATCEAIVAEFVYGPQRCRKPAVATAEDATWGTLHAVCAEHDQRASAEAVSAS